MISRRRVDIGAGASKWYGAGAASSMSRFDEFPAMPRLRRPLRQPRFPHRAPAPPTGPPRREA